MVDMSSDDRWLSGKSNLWAGLLLLLLILLLFLLGAWDEFPEMVPFLVRLLVEDCDCCSIVLFCRVLDVDVSTLLLPFGTFITIAGIRLGCDDGKSIQLVNFLDCHGGFFWH